MKLTTLVGTLGGLLAISSALAINDDGSGAAPVASAPMKIAIQNITRNRLSVVERVLASGAIPATGAFSDRGELREFLMQASDDVLARASLAVDSGALRSALSQGFFAASFFVCLPSCRSSPAGRISLAPSRGYLIVAVTAR